uniref:NADH dehydrogenase subunit 6 n=1 Tax=Doriprismatica atromarginata TaxID=154629 RepID=A0A895KWZ9_DORAT|nr:NADH dehydrogenase subunit 6 [Doriprismatica atromarginata]QRZ60625.1 NADH dehydrogenase subunit 6 [Doriprismatica atromarginata]
MFLIFWVCVSLIFSFPLFKNPISMAAMVVAISLYFVSMLSIFSSFWFSYVLFLVYVGGLLVMFIYICLVSSNYPFKFSISGLVFAFLISFLLSLMSSFSLNWSFLGCSNWISGETLLNESNVSIFLFLAILLLTMLLVVVRISGSGCFAVGNDKS